MIKYMDSPLVGRYEIRRPSRWRTLDRLALSGRYPGISASRTTREVTCGVPQVFTITWDASRKNVCLYTGHKFDAESGLYYSLYRYYQPGLGRWLSGDPVEEQGGQNLYAFCFNSPTVYVDTHGKAPISASGSGSALTAPGTGSPGVPSDADMKAELVAFALTRWQSGPCCATKIDYVHRGKVSRFRPEDELPYQIYVAQKFKLSGAPAGYDYSVCKIEQAVISTFEFQGNPLQVVRAIPDPALGPGVQADGTAPVAPSVIDIWLQRTGAPFKLKTFGIVYITNSSAVGPLIGNPVFSGQPHDVQKVTGNTPDYPSAGDTGGVNVGTW